MGPAFCATSKLRGRNDTAPSSTPGPSFRGPQAMLYHTSKISPASLEESMRCCQEQLRQHLRDYAIEVRQLAYTLPNGVGEHALLKLSVRMGTPAAHVPVGGS